MATKPNDYYDVLDSPLYICPRQYQRQHCITTTTSPSIAARQLRLLDLVLAVALVPLQQWSPPLLSLLPPVCSAFSYNHTIVQRRRLRRTRGILQAEDHHKKTPSNIDSSRNRENVGKAENENDASRWRRRRRRTRVVLIRV